MEFIAFDDGVIREEFYRNEEPKAQGFAQKPIRPFRPTAPAKANETKANKVNLGKRIDAKAAAFASNPAELIFRDFVVGKVYSIQITLTNCSKKFTTFRVLPISPASASVLAFEYTPPSQIPAGLSWPVKVIFTPTKDTAYSSEININTEDGYFSIPVKAIPRQPLVKVEPLELNFKTIVVGQSRQESVTLKNEGALATSVLIRGSFKNFIDKVQFNPLTGQEEPFFSLQPVVYRVDLPAHSERKFDVLFSPNEEIEIQCEIVFTEKTENSEKEIAVSISGKATNSPVYVSSEDIDFLWCYYGMTYKNEVTIYNNSNVSANVDPKVPADLREVLAFDPPSACIQPKSSYSFSVIFTPVDEIVDENFSIKANFKVKGQALPASLLIKAQLTHRQPEVSKNYFDLGEIFVNQEQAFSVSVKNSSKLIQTIGILDLPQNIKVSPDVLQFLPEEEVTLNFGIVPPCLGKFSQEIVVINEYGDKSPIIIDGVGKRPKLFFSDSQIALPPCAVGSSISASTVVTNTTGRAIQFQFKSSEKLISISPSFGTIAPGSTLPIFFELSTVFVPKSTEDTGKPAEQPRKKSQQRVRSKSQLSEAPQEPVTDFSSWKPISLTAKVKTASITCFDRENTDDAFLIDINCIVVEPVLVAACLIESAQASVAVKPNNVKASKKNKEISLPVDAVTVTPYSSKTKIDCGEISIFHSLERHVLIRNNSANPVQLRMLPMNPVSPFSIVRFPCSPLPPFSEDCCLLQFKPRDYGEYQESVVIYSEDTNRVELDLKGMCCFTNIIISEHESQAADFSDIETIGSFWFDTTIRGENSSKTLYLYNLGSFSLQVSLELSDADKEKHGVFLFHPSKFDVAAKSFTTVQLVFAPQEEGLTEADLKIKAGGFEEKMRLIGRSSATSVYTIIPLVDRHEEKINPSQMGLSHEYPLLFKFTKGETKRFMVGSVKNGPSVECFVEKWNDYYEAIGWKVDIFRFSVPGGTESRLSISLKSEQEQTKDVFIPFCRFTLNIKCSSDSQNDRVYYISCVGS